MSEAPSRPATADNIAGMAWWNATQRSLAPVLVRARKHLDRGGCLAMAAALMQTRDSAMTNVALPV